MSDELDVFDAAVCKLPEPGIKRIRACSIDEGLGRVFGEVETECDAALTSNPQFPDTKQLSNRAEKKVLPTAENVIALMKYAGVGVSYDVIQKRVRAINMQRHTDDENDFNDLCAMLQSEAGRHGLSQSAIPTFLDYIARKNPSNPPLDYLESLSAPKIDNPIDQLIDAADLTPKDFAKVVLRRWMIQACAAADYAKRGHSGARPEYGYVLILSGEQGVRKTSLINDLTPPSIRQYFSPGRTLELGNKDSLTLAVSNWIIELGELDATFKRSDIAALKAFLTNPSDQIRAPYAKEANRMSRRTVFAATVNHMKFLMDDTGNRRFWPLTVNRRAQLTDELVESLWAEAWQRYLSGEQWWLTTEEEAIHARVVTSHEERPLRDRLLDCYQFDIPGRSLRLSGTEILREIGWPNTDRSASTSLGLTLRELGIRKDGRNYLMPMRGAGNAYNL